MRDHPHSAITTYLSNELAKQWFATFAVYTYCTAHERLIGSNVHFYTDLITGDLWQAFVVLPGGPTTKPFNCDYDRELESYCDRVRNHVIRIIGHAYYCIIQNLNALHNTLLIP